MKKWVRGKTWQIVFLVFIFAIAASSTTTQAFEFRGFADINYADAAKYAPATPDDIAKTAGYRLGQLSLHAHEQLSDNLDAAVELFTTSSGIGLARLYVAYTFNETLKIRAGKWHKPLGYWNAAYHHGTLLQTTIEAPLSAKTGFTIVPMHETGIWASGAFQTQPLRLEYGISTTNGSKISCSGAGTKASPFSCGFPVSNDPSDNNGNKSFLFHLRAHPTLLSGLGIGISGSFEKVQGLNSTTTAPPLTLEVSQQAYAVDLEYINQQVEFISEYFLFKDKDKLGTTGTHDSSDWYVQLGYTIANRYIPYVRYERVSMDQTDPVIKFNSIKDQLDEKKALAGLRYNMTANSALKGEVQLFDPTVGNSYRRYALQWAFAF